MIPDSANYAMPKLFTHDRERCRDCAEKQKIVGVVGYRVLAREFGCGMATARDIITYRTRASA